MVFFGAKIVSPGGEIVGLFKSPAGAKAAQAAHWSFAGDIVPCEYLLEEDSLSIRRNSAGVIVAAY